MNYSAKNLFFFLFFSISFLINSQEISDNYLNTIPDYLKGEVVEGMSSNNEIQEKNLTAPDITLYKTEVMLEKLKRDLANINARFTETYLRSNESNELKRFGDDIFNTLQSSFAPNENFNPSNDYILDKGDIINVTIIGNNAGKHSLKINNDGSVNIPRIGKLNISGLTVSQAFANIKSFVQNSSLGSEVFTDIEGLKDIQIFLIGGVEVKGSYTLPGSSNILHAINAANGISKNGSYRKVDLFRNGELIKTFDLYDIFIHGNFKQNFQFQSGDMIKVGYVGQQVAISGGISNPAIYEYLEGDSLKDIIELAGGFTPYANKEKIEIVRSSENKESRFYVNEEKNSDFYIEPMDNIYIFSYQPLSQKVLTVEIQGEVNKPGKYDLPKDSSFADLLAMAGGYKKNSYPAATQLYRKKLQDAELQIREKLLDALSNSMFTSGMSAASGLQNNELQFFYRELNSFKPVGRLSGNLEMDSQLSSDTSPLLDDGDVIIVPKFSNTVSVYGQVNNPGTFMIDDENNKIETYLKYAGGTDFFADQDRIILIQPDGTSILVNKSFLSKFNKNDLIIYPGSMIYVPRDFVVMDDTQYLSIIAPIFSSLALSIASLNSL